jgi:hypothetical protein
VPSKPAPKPGGEGGDDCGGGDAASAAAREEEEREERVRSAVASMTFVELLFWSSWREVEQQREDYHLRDT